MLGRMLSDDTRRRIDGLIASDRVVLFMKGDRERPQCGFSATVVQILDEIVPDYATVDVLADPGLREGIKVYSSWPTIPQLYVGGEFIGGCDIVRELYGTGELHGKLGVEPPPRVEPRIEISAAAADFLRAAIERSGERLHLRIDPRFQARAYLGPEEPGEIPAEARAVAVHFDLASAARADGLRIDYVETEHGHDLAIDNPNAPPSVQEMDVESLAELLRSGRPVHLFDVRTPEERAIARIEGARLLDADATAEIGKLPKDAMLVFHCHLGGRSRQAAEHFRNQGFRNVHNVTGGIDAWSQRVDSSVPRY
jgi:monothiol glutaredoxin